MPVLQRVVKPTTRKGKKVLLSREPKLIENAKQTLFIKGRKTNEMLVHAVKDLYSLKKLHASILNRNNDFLPFEDIVPIENLLKKHQSSLFVFASHSKKRPNNIVLGRTYDSHLLDMIEVGVDSYKGLGDFSTEKVMMGAKPIIHFIGDFESNQELVTMRSLLADLFCCERNLTAVALAGIEHVLSFTSDIKGGKIHARSYRILLKKSGQKTPRVELEEIGPSFDLVIRRSKIASDDLMKVACRTPQELKILKGILFGNGDLAWAYWIGRINCGSEFRNEIDREIDKRPFHSQSFEWKVLLGNASQRKTMLEFMFIKRSELKKHIW